MTTPIVKAPQPAIWRLLHRLADESIPELRATFLQAVAQAQNGTVLPHAVGSAVPLEGRMIAVVEKARRAGWMRGDQLMAINEKEFWALALAWLQWYWVEDPPEGMPKYGIPT